MKVRPIGQNHFVIDGIAAESFGIAGENGVNGKAAILGYALQAYQSVIVFLYRGKVYLDINKWDYSNTTGRHRNQFLNETKKETQAKIDSAEYILTNLNQ